MRGAVTRRQRRMRSGLDALWWEYHAWKGEKTAEEGKGRAREWCKSCEAVNSSATAAISAAPDPD